MWKLDFAWRGLACAALLLAPTLLLAQTAARPDWKVGDTWTLRSSTTAGVGASAAKEETRVVKEVGEAGSKMEVSTKADGAAIPVEVRTINRDLNVMDPTAVGGLQEYRYLQWPIEVGKAYSFEVVVGENQTAKWSGKVAALEDVDVPAGKFKAHRIEFERSGPFRMAASDTFWFAPDARVFIKRLSKRAGTGGAYDNTATELVAFKLN